MYMQFIAKMIPTYKQMYQQVYDQQINLSILRYIDNEISYAISGKKWNSVTKTPMCVLWWVNPIESWHENTAGVLSRTEFLLC